jgi:hypothetical protein
MIEWSAGEKEKEVHHKDTKNTKKHEEREEREEREEKILQKYNQL